MTGIKKAGIYTTTIVIAFWFVTQTLYPASQTLTHGFGAYYSAAQLLRAGQFSAQVYDPAYFRLLVRTDSHQQADDIYNANPPTTSLMLWPLSFFSIETARLIWTLANAGMLLGGLALLTASFTPQPDLPRLALLASLGMLFQPALENIKLGQAYLLIFLLLSIAVAAWSKIGLAEAAGLKFAPSLGSVTLALALILKTAGWALLPLLAWQKRWRILAWTVGIAGAVLLLTLPLFPPPLWQRYGQLLGETNNSAATCATAYQTTRSLLCQLFVFAPPWSQSPVINLPWLAPTFLIGLAAFTLLANFRLACRDSSVALTAMITWGVIFAPLGEGYHHTVMLIPLSWLAIHWSALDWFSRFGVLAAACLYLIPFAPYPPDRQNGGWMLLAYPRLYGAWLTLLLLYRQSRLLH
ncbi:MAG: DUF2029 domain-containing protein [Anaerolineales bacterium]|nr:DUF2029 domain-containing protein [Anaerolineales bacterium]